MGWLSPGHTSRLLKLSCHQNSKNNSMLGTAWKIRPPPSFPFLWSQVPITDLLSFKLGISYKSPRSQSQKTTGESELSFPENQVSNLHGCRGIFQEATLKAEISGGVKKKTTYDCEKNNPVGNPTSKMPVVVLVSITEVFSMGVPERLCQDTRDEHRGLITPGHAAWRSRRSSPMQDGIGQAENGAVEQSHPMVSFHLTHSGGNA